MRVFFCLAKIMLLFDVFKPKTPADLAGLVSWLPFTYHKAFALLLRKSGP